MPKEVRGLGREVGGQEGGEDKRREMEKRIFPNESSLGRCNFLLIPVTLSLFQMSHSTFSRIWPFSVPSYLPTPLSSSLLFFLFLRFLLRPPPSVFVHRLTTETHYSSASLTHSVMKGCGTGWVLTQLQCGQGRERCKMLKYMHTHTLMQMFFNTLDRMRTTYVSDSGRKHT